MAAATIRSEEATDREGIRAVLEECFPSDAEAGLVDALRRSGRLTLSLVAWQGDRVVGHVGFSPVTVPGMEGGLGLAPLAVHSEFRRRGVGAQLVQAGLAACRELDCSFVVVLGDPAYYGRFGFVTASDYGLKDQFGGGENFQALPFREAGVSDAGGLVSYAPEFGDLPD